MNARDVTDRHRAEQIAAAQAGILELVARGAPLGGVLDDIVEMVEHWIPGSGAVITLVDMRTVCSTSPRRRASMPRCVARSTAFPRRGSTVCTRTT